MSATPITADFMSTDTKNVYLHCRVPASTVTAYKQIAKQEDRSVSYIMRQALDAYLNNHDPATERN